MPIRKKKEFLWEVKLESEHVNTTFKKRLILLVPKLSSQSTAINSQLWSNVSVKTKHKLKTKVYQGLES